MALMELGRLFHCLTDVKEKLVGAAEHDFETWKFALLPRVWYPCELDKRVKSDSRYGGAEPRRILNRWTNLK